VIAVTDRRCGHARFRSLVAAAGLIAAGCSPIKVLVDYDVGADFRPYETFDRLDNRPNVSIAADARDGKFAGWVYDAVTAELIEKGLRRDQVDPDILVIYYLGENVKIDVDARGYRYSGRYGGWGDPIDVFEYREGTLVLDLIDGRTMDLVWRAAARNVWDEESLPAESEARIGEAVKKMLASYPPVP
jgi:hypothetical protein